MENVQKNIPTRRRQCRLGQLTEYGVSHLPRKCARSKDRFGHWATRPRNEWLFGKGGR